MTNQRPWDPFSPPSPSPGPRAWPTPPAPAPAAPTVDTTALDAAYEQGRTIPEIQAVVGDDPAVAARALVLEQARSKPRSTLVDWLTERLG